MSTDTFWDRVDDALERPPGAGNVPAPTDDLFQRIDTALGIEPGGAGPAPIEVEQPTLTDSKQRRLALYERAPVQFLNALVLSKIEEARPSTNIARGLDTLASAIEEVGPEPGIRDLPRMWLALTRGYYSRRPAAHKFEAELQAARVAEGGRPTAEIEVPPPEGTLEFGIDVAASLGAFVVELAVAKRLVPKILPSAGPRLTSAVAWELLNTDGPPGSGAAMSMFLSATNPGKAASLAKRLGMTSVQSAAFAGMAKARGGDVREQVVAAAIPFVFATVDYIRERPMSGREKAKLRAHLEKTGRLPDDYAALWEKHPDRARQAQEVIRNFSQRDQVARDAHRAELIKTARGPDKTAAKAARRELLAIFQFGSEEIPSARPRPTTTAQFEPTGAGPLARAGDVAPPPSVAPATARRQGKFRESVALVNAQRGGLQPDAGQPTTGQARPRPDVARNYMERIAQESVLAGHTEAILDEKPLEISRRFFRETYPQLSEDGKRFVHRMIRKNLVGAKPGDVAWTKGKRGTPGFEEHRWGSWQEIVEAEIEDSQAVGDLERAVGEQAPKLIGFLDLLTAEAERQATPRPAPGEGQQAIAPALQVAPVGRQAPVTAQDMSIDVQYVVVPVGKLVTSHTATGDENPAYPSELQQRERGLRASREQIQQIAQKLQPERLGESAEAVSGAPIVGPDLAVVAGNARSMALREAYRTGRAEQYRRWLLDNAERFGLEKAEIEMIEDPVLVRAHNPGLAPEERVAFARAANVPLAAGLSLTEAARTDAERLTPAMLSQMSVLSSGQMSLSTKNLLVKGFIDTLPESERPTLLTRDLTTLNDLGRKRLTVAVLARVYGSADMTQEELNQFVSMIETGGASENIRNLVNALSAAAPSMGKVRGMVDAGEIAPEHNPIPLVNEAVQLFRSVRQYQDANPGISLLGAMNDVLGQQPLFGEGPSQQAKALARTFAENVRQPARIAKLLTEIAQRLTDPTYAKAQSLLPGFQEGRASLEQIVLDSIATSHETAPAQTMMLHAGLEIPGLRNDLNRIVDKLRGKLSDSDAQPLTEKQGKQLHALENERGLSQEVAQGMKLGVTAGRTDTSREFSQAEASAYITLLKKYGRSLQEAEKQPTVTAARAEVPQSEDLADPVLRKFHESLAAEMEGRRKAPETVKVSQFWDIDRALHAVEEKTGVPFFRKHQVIERIYRDNRYEAGESVKALFEGLELRPRDVIGNRQVEERIFDYLISGQADPAMTPDQVEVGNRMRERFKEFTGLVKRLRHKRFMKDGTVPPDATKKLMEEGRQVFDTGDAGAYDQWLERAAFGVRERYAPTHRPGAANARKIVQRLFGRGFAETRDAEDVAYDPNFPLVGDYYRYTLRALNIQKLEPPAAELEQLFKESGVNPGLMNRYFDNLYGSVQELDVFQLVAMSGMRQFFRVLIPQRLAKWVPRNLLQPTAFTLPKTFSPADPIFWRSLPELYKGAFRISGSRIFESMRADPVLKEQFDRYVSSLDAARQHYLFEDFTEWEAPRHLFHTLDTMAKAYSWSDTVNRSSAFFYGIKAGRESLERYQQTPTAKNWQRFLNVTGSQFAPLVAQQELAEMVDRGNTEQAVFLAAKRLSDSTQFKYLRAERGLAWQAVGRGGHILSPIATFWKGTIQDIYLDGIQPLLRGARAEVGGRGTAETRARSFKAAQRLLAWYGMSLLLNRLYEWMYDVDEGAYGLNILRYTPGGPVLQNVIRTSDAMWGAWKQDRGWDFKLAAAIHGMAGMWLPFYHLANKAAGAKAGRARYAFPQEVRRWFKEKVAESTGNRVPTDTRRWVERNSIQQAQFLILGGSWDARKIDLEEAYFQWQFEDDPGKREALRAQLEGLLRKYPVSTKRKDVPRKAEFFRELVPE